MRVTPELLRAWSLPPGGESKHDRGRILVVGGSRKSPGAAILAGLASLRVGGGRLTLAVGESVATAMAVAVPESGVIGLPEDAEGLIADGFADGLEEELALADVVLIGSGLQHPDEAAQLVSSIVAHLADETTVLLDAFALGILPDLGSTASALAGRLLLTPNREEAARLLGDDSGEGIENPDAQLGEIARRYGAFVTCYGTVAAPDGELWRIDEGGSGLGTSGSGDVLAGAVAGLAARGASSAQAACWGTYLHARAGDRLADRIGELGFLAREICEELPRVVAEVEA